MKILNIKYEILNLKLDFSADQQPGISPLHIEICIESDTEILIRYFGNIFDVNSYGDSNWLLRR